MHKCLQETELSRHALVLGNFTPGMRSSVSFWHGTKLYPTYSLLFEAFNSINTVMNKDLVFYFPNVCLSALFLPVNSTN